ncbi:MAG: DUF3794 domain-containing protein [Ruminococcus sp.]|nr:DUF3794 domain-containing protein [Ruminococcus sp.]
MNASQLRVTKETLIRCCTALDTTFEQSVEKDFVLPDYCPDVFRILKCRVIPRVTSQSINGGRMTVDTEAVIKVMYLSEGNGRVNLLEQKLSFTRSFELPKECISPSVNAVPRLEYVNCRVISQRRVDVRGAFSVRVKVTGEERSQFITDAQGCNVQLLRRQTSYPAKRLTAAKRITVVEDLELGGAKPPVGAVLRTACRFEQQEQKIIQGKLITKGEATVDLLYTPAESEALSIEAMRFGLPYSQIIDIDGIDESYTVNIDIISAGCEIIPKPNAPEQLECELVMLVSCEAYKYESCEAVTDAFSTVYAYSTEQCGFDIGGTPVWQNESFRLEGTLNSTGEEIASIASAWCETGSVSVRGSDGKSVVSGSITMSAIGSDITGTAIYLENELPFEYELEGGTCEDAEAFVTDCSYHLADGNTVEIKADIAVKALSSDAGRIIPLSGLEIDENTVEKPSDGYALKLCAVSAGETLWDIAKRCRTSIKAIIEENDLTSDKTEESGMLLIPLIN